MTEYTKKWLSIDDQIEKLMTRGIQVPDHARCVQLLRAVGYYRLTGYLYPFRESERYTDDNCRGKTRILNHYRAGTTIDDAAALIDFDRKLRMLVLDGIERIEISLRMQIGYVLGQHSPFAHLNRETFVTSFSEPQISPVTGNEAPSKHEEWIERMLERQSGSDEAFVDHFRKRYDNQMPIWALTEIMELGHLSRLYAGLSRSLSTEIANAYSAPSKRVMGSWIASLNYVRNVSAHHARLYNRKLVAAPSRPKPGQVPLLDHMRDDSSSKAVFGLYNALAVMAYLLRSIEPDGDWAGRVGQLIEIFPTTGPVTTRAIGAPDDWAELELWRP